jgi:hypothetical protein
MLRPEEVFPVVSELVLTAISAQALLNSFNWLRIAVTLRRSLLIFASRSSLLNQVYREKRFLAISPPFSKSKETLSSVIISWVLRMDLEIFSIFAGFFFPPSF